MSPPDILPQLAAIVGARHVWTGADAAPHYQDWRKRYHSAALCVVRPGSTDEVAAVVQACSAAGVAIVPQGGNTGLVGAGVPLQATMPANTQTTIREEAPACQQGNGNSTGTGDNPIANTAPHACIVLSLQRMQRVRNVDAANQTITVEAGCVLQAVQQAAADAGWLFPLSMASEGSCTIGGNLSTNAGGTQVLRYGNARELCLGLEVVTPQGEVWNGLSGLRKNNTGYDLRDLFIGAEGTLGVITAATMKLFVRPSAQHVAWVAVPSLQAALDLLTLARQHLHAGVTGFEVMGQFALSLVASQFPTLRVPLWHTAPWCVLLEHAVYDTSAHTRTPLEDMLQAALDAGYASDCVLSANAAQAQALWQVRESIPLAQAQQGLNIKHDIALPISAIVPFVQHTDAAIAQAVPGVRFVNFGHMGDGNLHYNVQCPSGGDQKQFLAQHEAAINTLVFDAVTHWGGSISAEHGIGQLKRHALRTYQSPIALRMMHAIKHALDPHHIMNPGKIL